MFESHSISELVFGGILTFSAFQRATARQFVYQSIWLRIEYGQLNSSYCSAPIRASPQHRKRTQNNTWKNKQKTINYPRKRTYLQQQMMVVMTTTKRADWLSPSFLFFFTSTLFTSVFSFFLFPKLKRVLWAAAAGSWVIFSNFLSCC